MRRLFVVVCLLGAALAALPAAAAGRGVAVLVALDGPIDQTTVVQVRRGLAEAGRAGAGAVVLDIDSTDGLDASALQIRDAILASGVPVDAYVRRATSAGTLVALAAKQVAVAPGAMLGDVPPSPPVAALRARTAPTLGDALAMFGIGATTQPVTLSPLERLVRLATSPAISGLLLAIAFLGLLIELQTLHVVAGAAGALALAAFFGAHVAGGFADTTTVAIGLAGIALIFAELHVFPGHGVAGVLGIGALIASVVLAFGLPFVAGALQALAVAIVLSALAFALLQRVLPENAFVRRLTFAGAQGPDYVAGADYRSLLGASGVAVSFLRPVGLASFGERRVDVLSEGEFVPAGTPVRVTRVEGARIFVRPEVEP